MSDTWQPGQYHDSYREDVLALVKKSQGETDQDHHPARDALQSYKCIDFDQASR